LRGATLVVALLPATLAAQRRSLEAYYGRWLNGNDAASYELRSSAPLAGQTLRHGFGVTVLVHDSLGRHRAFYGFGYELQAFRYRAPLAPYALIGLELGLSTDTVHQELGALWSAGAGLEWRPLGRFALGAEARWRVEDRGPRGFWRPGHPRRGFSVALGVSLGLGRGGGAGRGREGRDQLPPGLPPPPTRPSPAPPAEITGAAADVVLTAISAIGTPYQWGGTAENGFDCSGLIQYSYAQHGIRLPRMSREQARAGDEVTPVVEALQPGDILLFAASPGGGVTHVGLYVGGGKFIHSSNTGVRLSQLDPHDPEAGYWVPRWVGARRIIAAGRGR
jgi:hypothetical protein